MTITEAAKRLRYAKLEAEIRRQGARLAVNFVFNTKVFYYVPVRGGNEEAMRSMPKNDLVKDAFVLELMKVQARIIAVRDKSSCYADSRTRAQLQGYRGSGSTSRPATVRRAPELPASPSTPVAAGEGVEQLTYVPGVVPSPSALSPGTMLAASQQQLIHMSPAASGVQRANPPPMRRVLQVRMHLLYAFAGYRGCCRVAG